jgi:hypothetical protein
MKNIHKIFGLVALLALVTFSSCKKKKPRNEFLSTNCFVVKEARYNGAVVYVEGGTSNTNPSFAKYKIVTNEAQKSVELTLNDGTVTRGSFSLNGDVITFSGLNPALTDQAAGTTTRTTQAYTIGSYDAKKKTIVLDLATKDLKIGDGNTSLTFGLCP